MPSLYLYSLIIPKALLNFAIQKGIIFDVEQVYESSISEAIRSKKNMGLRIPFLIPDSTTELVCLC